MVAAQSKVRRCKKCKDTIPSTKRSDAVYCSDRCRSAAEKKRYCDSHPEYVKRQRRLVTVIRHMQEFGHLEYMDNPIGNKRDKYAKARSLGYRSMLEVKIAKQLEEAGIDFGYETLKLPYKVSEVRTYVPDLVLPNGIIIETKGRFVAADRKKHLLIKKQHPELDIRFVFSNSKTKLSKSSKTTYGAWCAKHGYLYADKEVPLEWLKR